MELIGAVCVDYHAGLQAAPYMAAHPPKSKAAAEETEGQTAVWEEPICAEPTVTDAPPQGRTAALLLCLLADNAASVSCEEVDFAGLDRKPDSLAPNSFLIHLTGAPDYISAEERRKDDECLIHARASATAASVSRGPSHAAILTT
jgi:hypothetical protein